MPLKLADFGEKDYAFDIINYFLHDQVRTIFLSYVLNKVSETLENARLISKLKAILLQWGGTFEKFPSIGHRHTRYAPYKLQDQTQILVEIRRTDFSKLLYQNSNQL